MFVKGAQVAQHKTWPEVSPSRACVPAGMPHFLLPAAAAAATAATTATAPAAIPTPMTPSDAILLSMHFLRRSHWWEAGDILSARSTSWRLRVRSPARKHPTACR
eukprot:TRINITY_DN78793_c0_g1_i1.p4 TRINITY_DN78793_c0_g1~~TRINITY_DN78793_c0_g1_i1.p4  ORF type:complete len:105 (+),score=5.76 TRINITY_DN78793_c0_g1_i1:141-455(+)